MTFLAFLSYGKNELEKQKADLTQKCEQQRDEDARALADEEKEYLDRIAQEHQYFEFVNTLRLLSRELFTKVNPEKGAHKIDLLL
jgi:RNA polymerase-binding transcription factor DksA